MNLAGLFSGNANASTSSIQSNHQTIVKDFSNNQLKLSTGQTVSGSILSAFDGKISLSINGSVISGNVTSDLHFTKGQELTFVVKEGTSGQIILSPLYENTANSENIMNALKAANLPLVQDYQWMVSRMMSNGLPIHKEALQGMFGQLQNFGMEKLEQLIGLTKLGITVNEENLQQYGNYEKLSHALIRGMTDVIKEIPLLYQELSANGNPEMANQLQKNIISILFPQNTEKIIFSIENSTFVPTENSNDYDMQMGNGEMSESVEELKGNGTQVKVDLQNIFPEERTLQEPFALADILGKNELENLKELLGQLGLKNAVFLNQESGMEFLKKLIQELGQGQNGKDYAKLMAAPSFQKVVQTLLEEQWLRTPEHIDKESVKQLYEKLFEQTTRLAQTLSEIEPAKNSQLFDSVSNLRNNLEFMNQINQFSTYIQLPLKLQGQQGNGDLYVFTDKKSLAQKNGSVTALLHLDLEQLGPLDVFVAMTNQQVKTKFYVAEDEMLSFISDHLHLLHERLTAKGYQMNLEVLPRQEMKSEGLEEDFMNLLLKKGGQTALSKVEKGFDMKA